MAKSELEGFGIVTLASLLPVLMVQLFGIYLTFAYRWARHCLPNLWGLGDLKARAGKSVCRQR